MIKNIRSKATVHITIDREEEEEEGGGGGGGREEEVIVGLGNLLW